METRNDLSLPRELLDAADSPSARDREAFVKNLRALPPDAVLVPHGGVTFAEGRTAPASNVHVISTDGGERLDLNELHEAAHAVGESLAREHGRTTAKLKTRAQSPARKRRLRNRLARLGGDMKRVRGYMGALEALEEQLSKAPASPAPACIVSGDVRFDGQNYFDDGYGKAAPGEG